ncbi:site-specific DNA-methyltransferase [candidate division KSB1 bacterium]|nr:site-specific DNA-methyltransferase [candidate division KSB1 bacterium]RQW02102.1 MAG: site-specific DNA-methyltransferase [candidate division KSB1 bacterium]
MNEMKELRTKDNFCLIFHSDSREILGQLKYKADLVVTSPPYADSRKNHYDSIHPDAFAEWFFSFHTAIWNILKADGNFVLNIKDKIVNGVRHRFVWDTITKLADSGWMCIDDYIWHKPNPMPGYWPTRLRDGWEYCFHLSKIVRPFINQDAVKIPVGDWVKTRLQNLGEDDTKRHNSSNNSGFGRNISNWSEKKQVLPYNVLTVPLVGKNKGHPAVFPLEIPNFFINLLSRHKSLIIDPFGGSGTTAVSALNLGRDCILIDTNFNYCEIAYHRLLAETSPLLTDVYFVDEKNIIIASRNNDLISEDIYNFREEFLLTA